MNLSKRRISVLFLLAFALASYGFTFDFQEWGKSQQKKTSTSSNSAQADKKSDGQSDSGERGAEEGVARAAVPSLAQPIADTEIVEIQNQIKQIAEQTKIVEQQSALDRAHFQKVLQQVQIQKKLVDSLKTPKPVASGAAVDTDEIIRQAKLRLIAEDVRRTQETLRASKVITPISKPVRTVKTQER